MNNNANAKSFKQKGPVPLEKLNLTNRFLFDETVEDIQTHQDIVSIILQKEVQFTAVNQTEKEIRNTPDKRSIRLDVFAKDEDDIVYNTEMQERRKDDLLKRSRYYQGLMDATLLDAGIPDYNKLNNTYFIMIMPFDLFGKGKYQYTCETVCRETGEVLRDGAVKIFLNTYGTNPDEVPEELVEFLNYVNNSTDEQAAASKSEAVRRIHNRVRKVRSDKEVGVKYMQDWEAKYYDRQEARQEGRAEGLAEGRAEGLTKGEVLKLISQVGRKIRQGRTPEQIAEDLAEELAEIQRIYDAAVKYEDNYDREAIYAELYPAVPADTSDPE